MLGQVSRAGMWKKHSVTKEAQHAWVMGTPTSESAGVVLSLYPKCTTMTEMTTSLRCAPAQVENALEALDSAMAAGFDNFDKASQTAVEREWPIPFSCMCLEMPSLCAERILEEQAASPAAVVLELLFLREGKVREQVFCLLIGHRKPHLLSLGAGPMGPQQPPSLLCGSCQHWE